MAKTRRGPRSNVEKADNIEGAVLISGPTGLIPDQDFIRGKSPFNQLPFEMSRPMEYHAWVYACIRALAQNIGAVPLRIQGGRDLDIRDIQDEDDEAPASLLAQLFARPNTYTTSFQLWENTVALMNLDGTGVWVLDREDFDEIPENITVHHRRHFKPVINPRNGELLGWLYQPPGGGDRIPLGLHQVLVFKFFNPDDTVWGLSPLKAAMRGVRLDIKAGRFGEDFFENNADPSGIIVSEKRLSKSQAEQILDFWENRHRGPGNAKKIGILYGGMKWQATSISQKDMEYLEQRKWTRDEVLAVFKVPKAELSLYEDVANATAISQDRGFWQKTLLPFLRNFEAVLRAHFIPGLRWIDPDLKIFFDLTAVPALQPDFNEQVKNAEVLYRIGYPVNEINRKLNLGMPMVPHGDIWFLNSAFATVDQVIAGIARGGKPSHPTVPGADNVPDETDETPDDVTPPSSDDSQDSRAARSKHSPSLSFIRSSSKRRLTPQFSSSQALSLRAAQFETFTKTYLDPIASAHKEQMRAHLFRLRKHQLAKVMSSEDDPLFDEGLWNRKLFYRVNPLYMDLMVKVSNFLSVQPKPFDLRPLYDFHKELRIALVVMKDQSSTDDKLDRVREIFNKAADHKHLMAIAKMEIGRVILVAESARRDLT